MNFDEAFKLMQEGAAIARPHWKRISYYFYKKGRTWAYHSNGRIQNLSIFNIGLAEATDWHVVAVESLPDVPDPKPPIAEKPYIYCPGLTRRQSEMKARYLRVDAANKLIKVIAECGRRFFYHYSRTSRLEMDKKGRIWFIDAYTQKRIYTSSPLRWRGFSESGTMRFLIEDLRDFIRKGKQITGTQALGPWPDYFCEGDVWGYGSDMQQVRDAALSLGIQAKEGRAKA